ncbi:hypothetical protein Btru_040783 [Bulinus truncatus]|nr:hypothetical protein Btru_040783 [Bulinus truncatus]
MEPPTNYLPSASLHRPTFSTYMRANPFSKIKAVYLMDHQRRLAELGDRPYLRQLYPELPVHYPGTWCVYSWPDIEAVVDRLYTIPRHWQVPNRTAAPGRARLSVDSPPVCKLSRGQQSRTSAEFRPGSSLSSRLTYSTSTSYCRSAGSQRMNQRKYCVTPRSRVQMSDSMDADTDSDRCDRNDDNVSICSKTYSLLQTISSTDGKIEPVFSKWNRQGRTGSKKKRRNCESRQQKPEETESCNHHINKVDLKKDVVLSNSFEEMPDCGTMNSVDKNEDIHRIINGNQKDDSHNTINGDVMPDSQAIDKHD